MDTPERSELTPWVPNTTPLSPHAVIPGWDSGHEPPPPPKLFNPRVIWRATKRHWWQILAIWFFGTIGLAYLAYTKVNPNYDAIAWIEVEPAARSLLSQVNQSGAGDAFAPYLETQVLLITSPDVLYEAISDPNIKKLPKVRASIDPEIDLRKEIAVTPLKGTHMIKVLMSGESSAEVTKIVNAVVNAYLAKAKFWTEQEVRTQIALLEEMKKKYENDVKTVKDELKEMMKKAGEAQVPGKDRKEGEPMLGTLTISWEQYHELKMNLYRIEMQRVQQESRVTQLLKEINDRSPSSNTSVAAGPSADGIEELIEDEFKSLPSVSSVIAEMEKAQNRLDSLGRLTRSRSDPAVKLAQKRKDDAQAQYDALWKRMYEGLKRKVIREMQSGVGGSDGVMASRENELRIARQSLNDTNIQKKFVEEQIKNAEVKTKDATNQMVDIQFLNNNLNYNEQLVSTVRRNLEQLQYEANNATRIKPIAMAKITGMPSSNNRYKLMAAAPVLMLLLSVGLFVMLEAKSGRVADPDDLAARLHLGVIGVVPPLPSLQPARTLSLRAKNDEKRRVEEFVQSLDHLRVTLCAPKQGKSHRRCVLITSATGGEGKTTLAAQLAGRCANAGLMTLLIDADLRRPSLGELLEVPEGPGFVDVLNGEVAPETAMVVIGNAGGFHLLPAGTTGLDPSRLLHSDRLSLLIGQFRETFDMVIIDAPPVLAVPDALLLGRWTDGAVLAVRHDTSRFPLVERANRRLASVGVPVLGAVVNGARTMESSYGSYRYTPYAAAGAPADAGEPPLE